MMKRRKNQSLDSIATSTSVTDEPLNYANYQSTYLALALPAIIDMLNARQQNK